MEVLIKGPILDWTSDGKLHERFIEWKKKVCVLCKGLRMTKADPEFTCLCIYQWLGERGQNILDKATFSEADIKNWEKHLKKLEEHCKPRGSKLVAATQYKVLTQGDMELPEYIEKCRQITDACGWPENAKDMALRNAILFGLKNPMVYQKCLEENQDTLTADRVIEIATDIYNSDCQRSIMQTLSTASAAATAIQQGSTQVHKLQGNHQEYGKSEKGHGKNFNSQDKDGMKRQDCYCCGARPAHPKSKCPAKDVICHNCGKKGYYQKCCKSKRAKPGKNRTFKQTQVHDLLTQPVDRISQPPINRIQAPTSRLNRSSSIQVSQHCFTIFRCIMLRALMTLQASISSHFGCVQQVKDRFTKLSVRSTQARDAM